jgi:hypothetical protein
VSTNTEAWRAAIEAAKVLVVVVGGIWAYFLFVRQRTHAPHIEFDLSGRFLGPQEGARIVHLTKMLPVLSV